MATMSWDDGKHTKVKSVQLTFDDVIKSIEVAYEGTSLKSQQRGTVGTKSDGFTLSPDEYITEVNGYYKTTFSGDVITSLTFKTNKRTYGTYGNKTRNYFSVTCPKDKQIVGFLGSSSHALNSIDAHFAPLGSTGGNTGETGSNAGNTNTTGTTGGTGSNTGSSTGGTGTDTSSNTGGNGSNTDGSNTGRTESNIGGTGTNIGSNTGDISNTDGSNTGGTGTNTGSSNGQTGSTTDNTGSNTGNTGTNTGYNIGGAGSNSGGTINTSGAGSNNGGTSSNSGGTGTNTNDSESTGGTGLNTGSGSNTDSSPQKLEAQWGKIGNQWDDGADHDGVTKIHVAAGGLGIEQVKFDYVKNGQSKEGPFHGVKGRGDSSTIVVNYPDEYLVSVEGWYDSSNNIQGIQFKTNTKTSPYFGYDFSGDGKQFSLQVKDKKIIGFHGFADSHLNSLGAYFVPISSSSSSLTPPPSKVLAQGGNYGEKFDDGAFDHVRKVYVGQGDSGVAYVKFDYEKDGNIETREHGKMTLLGTEDFEVDSDDYITSVEVYVDKVYGYKSEIVIALTFKTFKGKTSPRFGFETENKYEVKDGKGGKLAGFHGNASDVLYAIGAYFSPTTTSTTPSAAKKLQAKGGNGGASWDDGVFDGVKKILVGQGTDGVAFVTFEYNKGSQAVIGDGHGKQTLLGTETFELDYPSEYITSVEGYYDKIFGVEAEVITNLTFKTNKRTSQPFGLTAGEHFELKEDGFKIVGFHGKASDVVHQIGVHVVPI